MVPHAYNIFIVLGTLFPLIGCGVTGVLALLLTGKNRWAVLLLGPISTFLFCMFLVQPVARNGNLLFAVLIGGLLVGLFLYYPFILLYLSYCWYQRRQKETMKKSAIDR